MEADVTVADAWHCLPLLNTIGGNSESESESVSNADNIVAYIWTKSIYYKMLHVYVIKMVFHIHDARIYEATSLTIS